MPAEEAPQGRRQYRIIMPPDYDPAAWLWLELRMESGDNSRPPGHENAAVVTTRYKPWEIIPELYAPADHDPYGMPPYHDDEFKEGWGWFRPTLFGWPSRAYARDLEIIPAQLMRISPWFPTFNQKKSWLFTHRDNRTGRLLYQQLFEGEDDAAHIAKLSLRHFLRAGHAAKVIDELVEAMETQGEAKVDEHVFTVDELITITRYQVAATFDSKASGQWREIS